MTLPAVLVPCHVLVRNRPINQMENLQPAFWHAGLFRLGALRHGKRATGSWTRILALVPTTGGCRESRLTPNTFCTEGARLCLWFRRTLLWMRRLPLPFEISNASNPGRK